MKLKVMKDKGNHFYGGMAAFGLGLYMFLRRLYLATPVFSGVINIGNTEVYTGVFAVPLVLCLVWLLLANKKKPALVGVGVSVAIVLASTLFSVSIRLGRTGLITWLVIMVLILAGAVLVLSSVQLESARGRKRQQKR